jgi:hypothetical protein
MAQPGRTFCKLENQKELSSLQVAIYDNVENTRTLVEFPAGSA